MGSFGERLRREREMRGISLEEIAEATKIGSRSLRALEDEDFEKLPGGIFNKGFVRAYAKYLGIDEEQAVADFLATCGEEEQPLPNPPEKERPVELKEPSYGKWVLLALLLLVAAGLLSWRWNQRKHMLAGLEQSAQPAAQPVQSAPQESPAPVAQTAQPSDGAEPQSGIPAAATPAANTIPTPRPAAVSSPAKPDLSDRTPAAAGNKFTLDIKAIQDSWVEITVDGKVVTSGMMKADGERSFSATKQIVLRAGNSGGLTFSHNGKPVVVATKEGQPRTFTFTADGLQP